MELPSAIEERRELLSIKKFITDALNIDPLLIESVDCLESDDESLTVFVRLKQMQDPKNNLCGGPLVSNSSYKNSGRSISHHRSWSP